MIENEAHIGRSRRINLIWQVPSSVTWERDWLFELLQDFEVCEIVDGEYNVVLDKSIVITQGYKLGNYEAREYFKKFKDSGFNVGCFHVSDEMARQPVDFYKYCNFVFRNYYRNIFRAQKNFHYFGLGYKSGFCQSLVQKRINERTYYLSFIGQLKASRTTMLQEAKAIQRDSFLSLTEDWNDPNQLQIGDYARILSDTVFALCPMGNISMDTFRFYEALEAGAIPIVESRTFAMVLSEIASHVFRYESGIRIYLKRCYPLILQVNYWKHAYGKDFPIPVIYDWKNLNSLLSTINIEDTSKIIQSWWKDYKKSLINQVTKAIAMNFR